MVLVCLGYFSEDPLTRILIDHISTVKAQGRLKPIRRLKLREIPFLTTSSDHFWNSINGVKGLGHRKYLLSGVRATGDIAKISVTEDWHEPCTLEVSVALMISRERGVRFNEILRVYRLTLQEREVFRLGPALEASPCFITRFDALLVLPMRFLSAVEVFHAQHDYAADPVLSLHKGPKNFCLIHN
jgi:hypothetical protein